MEIMHQKPLRKQENGLMEKRAVQSGSSPPRRSGPKQEFLLCLDLRTMTLEGRGLIPPSYPRTRVLRVYLNLGLLDMTEAFAGNH